jgi:hypothetical protein
VRENLLNTTKKYFSSLFRYMLTNRVLIHGLMNSSNIRFIHLHPHPRAHAHTHAHVETYYNIFLCGYVKKGTWCCSAPIPWQRRRLLLPSWCCLVTLCVRQLPFTINCLILFVYFLYSSDIGSYTSCFVLCYLIRLQLIFERSETVDLKRVAVFTVLGLALVGPTLHVWYMDILDHLS